MKAIILNDAAILSAGECDRLREFVRNGGTLIATGQSSYYSTDGKTTGDFALKDIFGVSFTGKFSRDWNYLVPEQGELISCDAPAPLVRTTTAKVLARLAEPMFDKDDFEHFASYHSNPPAPAGEFAAMTVNRFGQGTCVYLAQSILVKQLESQQAFAERVFREYASSSILLSCNAPPCVEVTLLRSTKKSSYLLCLVNYQDEPENVPVSNIAVSITLPGSAIATACTSVAANEPVAVERADRRLSFRISRLETIEMIEIETKESNA